ncbi:MAG: PIG-L family deacetylase [Candidatus Sungbacteria bacterium]|nr:PIG-L family deacetylase [Candidatus Sungbacteria bacterium]
MKSLVGSKKKFLVFSAHPDDVDFGCSATVARLTSEGNEVVYCIITNGEKGVHNVRQSKRAMTLMREAEQRTAAKIAGVDEVIFLRQTDGSLENTLALRKMLTRVIREARPDIVLAYDPGNHAFDLFGRFHRDHRITAEAVFDSIYPAAGSLGFFPELAKANIMPHQIEEVWFWGTDKPNLWVDVSKTMDKKIQALRAHESQIKDVKAMEKRMRDRARDAVPTGRQAGKKKRIKYVETFRRLTF